MWLRFTYDKCFDRWDISSPLLVIPEHGVVTFYTR